MTGPARSERPVKVCCFHWLEMSHHGREIMNAFRVVGEISLISLGEHMLSTLLKYLSLVRGRALR